MSKILKPRPFRLLYLSARETLARSGVDAPQVISRCVPWTCFGGLAFEQSFNDDTKHIWQERGTGLFVRHIATVLIGNTYIVWDAFHMVNIFP